MATNSDSGQSSPLGDGRGGASCEKAKPADLIKNPGGSGTTGPRPNNPLTPGATPKADAAGPDPSTIPGGGRFPKADPPPRDGIGVRATGNPKPFKLMG